MHRVLIGVIDTADLSHLVIWNVIGRPPKIATGSKFLTLDVATQGVIDELHFQEVARFLGGFTSIWRRAMRQIALK
jgi:hypothetical protein